MSGLSRSVWNLIYQSSHLKNNEVTMKRLFTSASKWFFKQAMHLVWYLYHAHHSTFGTNFTSPVCYQPHFLYQTHCLVYISQTRKEVVTCWSLDITFRDHLHCKSRLWESAHKVMHCSHGSNALYMYPLFFFQCPVFDLVRNVEFSGEYQTVTKKGAITVTVRKFFCFQCWGELCVRINLRNRTFALQVITRLWGGIS